MRSLSDALRPSWIKLAIALFSAGLLSMAGFYLYFNGSCWSSPANDCAGYSPTQLFFAYLFSWPVFLIQKVSTGSAYSSNYDRAVFHEFGWLALWAYYYTIVSFVMYFRTAKRHSAR